MYWNKSEKWYTMPEMTTGTINMRWYTTNGWTWTKEYLNEEYV
jgi:hypothetical protein